jgi:hypothetical protein
MKYKVIYLILTTIILNTNAQMNSVFSLKEKINKDIGVDVYFYKNGDYQIIMQEIITNDIIDEFIISSGKYSIKNNQIICRDWFNGFESVFCNKKDSMIVRKSFYFINNKSFIKSKFQITTIRNFKN